MGCAATDDVIINNASAEKLSITAVDAMLNFPFTFSPPLVVTAHPGTVTPLMRRVYLLSNYWHETCLRHASYTAITTWQMDLLDPKNHRSDIVPFAWFDVKLILFRSYFLAHLRCIALYVLPNVITVYT